MTNSKPKLSTQFYLIKFNLEYLHGKEYFVLTALV